MRRHQAATWQESTPGLIQVFNHDGLDHDGLLRVCPVPRDRRLLCDAADLSIHKHGGGCGTCGYQDLGIRYPLCGNRRRPPHSPGRRPDCGGVSCCRSIAQVVKICLPPLLCVFFVSLCLSSYHGTKRWRACLIICHASTHMLLLVPRFISKELAGWNLEKGFEQYLWLSYNEQQKHPIMALICLMLLWKIQVPLGALQVRNVQKLHRCAPTHILPDHENARREGGARRFVIIHGF